MSNSTFIQEFFDGKRTGRDGYERHHQNLLCNKTTLYSWGKHFPLAVETVSGKYILNGDSYSQSTSQHQSETRYACPKKYIEIPFTVLREAEIDPREIEIIQSREADIRTLYDPMTGEGRKEHRLGASLICYKDRYFLSSTDPSAHWRFGYFLTELSNSVKTIYQAFQSLKPDPVKQAKKKDVKRQGEWFFIRFGNSKKLKEKIQREENLFFPISIRGNIRKKYLLPRTQSNAEQHHVVRDVIETGFGLLCRGTVRHTDKHHKILNLAYQDKLYQNEDWYLAFNNCQVNSWSADGRID